MKVASLAVKALVHIAEKLRVSTESDEIKKYIDKILEILYIILIAFASKNVHFHFYDLHYIKAMPLLCRVAMLWFA